MSQPGAYASTPAWWSREHWRSELLSDLHSDDVREIRAAVGTRGPVSVPAIYAVAVAISAAADGATGRNALPGNAALTVKARDVDDADPAALAQLAASSGYGLTTVQKAVQVLGRRGWLVLVRAGKNRGMTPSDGSGSSGSLDVHAGGRKRLDDHDDEEAAYP